MTVVVIGDALIDEMRGPEGSVEAPGGSALNVAVGLAVLEVPSTVVAMIGDDVDGDTLVRYLAAHDVATVASPAPLGTGRAVSDRTDGEPRYSFTRAQRERRIDFTLASNEIAAADLVAVSGFPFDNLEQVSQLRHAVTGLQLLIDPNPRPGLLRDRKEFARNLEKLAPMTRLFKIGDDDAHLVWEAPLELVARRLLDAGAGAVLATAGEQGATVYSHEGQNHHPIVQLPRAVVDTMGAGDATFAAVIAQTLSSSGWETALRVAMEIAAETIRHPGGLLRKPTV